MLRAVWTDINYESNIQFSEIFQAPNTAHFCYIFLICKRYVRKFVWPEGADHDNDVMVLVNCYDVVSPIPHCCKCDISECYFVVEFVRILILELLLLSWEKLQAIDLRFIEFSSTILWTIKQIGNIFGCLANM